MRVLVLGANGFIGEAVCRKLVDEGHAVSGLGREIGRASARQPYIRWIRADLARMRRVDDWAKLVGDVDAVVNAAGVLQDGARDNVAAVQASAMGALYQAARRHGDRLIVQISANTAGAGADTAFLATKRGADKALKASGLPHVILRPALVIGRNAYGGTALIRALAGFPFITPLAFGAQRVHTVALEDVAQAVADALAGRIASGSDLSLAYPKSLPLAELVAYHRRWLGLRAVPSVAAPGWAGRIMAGLADLAGRFGWRSPLRSTALAVMEGGVAPADAMPGQTDTDPRTMLSRQPAGVQDIWFARLYLLKPVILLSLAFFWVVSGVVALVKFDIASAYLQTAGFSSATAVALTWITSLADIAVGIGAVLRRTARRALAAMIGLSLAYLAVGTLLSPGLWADPLGPLVKVIPSIVLALVALAILDER